MTNNKVVTVTLNVVDVSEGECGLAYDAYGFGSTFADALENEARKLNGHVVGATIVVGCRKEDAAEKLAIYARSVNA